jgi:drug/metabolite transporter (DMT)-like permease
MRGILFMVLGGALLTLNDAIMKGLTGGYPIGEIMTFRGLFVLIPIMLFLKPAGGLQALAIHNRKGQFIRAVLVVGSTFCFVTGLSLLPLADAIALTFAGPLFMTALASTMLGEFVGWRRWAAVLLGFAGVVIMLRPGAGAINWAAALPLGAALAGAFRDIITRQISATDSSISILVVTTGSVTLAGLATLPFGWVWPSSGDLMLLAGAGLLLAGAHYLLIEALRLAEVTVIAPFKYVSLIWATLFGFLIWGQWPDTWTWAGSALVVLSGLYILHREARRGIAENRSSAA